MRVGVIIGAAWSAAVAASFAAYQLVEDGAIDAVATIGLGLGHFVLWLALLLLIARC